MAIDRSNIALTNAAHDTFRVLWTFESGIELVSKVYTTNDGIVTGGVKLFAAEDFERTRQYWSTQTMVVPPDAVEEVARRQALGLIRQVTGDIIVRSHAPVLVDETLLRRAWWGGELGVRAVSILTAEEHYDDDRVALATAIAKTVCASAKIGHLIGSRALFSDGHDIDIIAENDECPFADAKTMFDPHTRKTLLVVQHIHHAVIHSRRVDVCCAPTGFARLVNDRYARAIPILRSLGVTRRPSSWAATRIKTYLLLGIPVSYQAADQEEALG